MVISPKIQRRSVLSELLPDEGKEAAKLEGYAQCASYFSRNIRIKGVQAVPHPCPHTHLVYGGGHAGDLT
jgi:hypothetical protein